MKNKPFHALLALVALAAPTAAQTPPEITAVRIGLRAGGTATRSRNGAWAPVYVTLRAGAEGHPRDAYRLAVETVDAEEAPYRTTAAVPALAGGEERVVLAYVVPSGNSEFTVKLETTGGQEVQKRAREGRDAGPDAVVAAGDVLFLGLGPGLTQLRRAGEKLDKQGAPEAQEQEAARRQFAFAESVEQLPDRWIGYDAVDVVVLGTGHKEFVERLLGDAARRNALLEWVRRGGRLVLSVGRNQQFVARLLEKMPLIDCGVTGGAVVPALGAMSSGWCNRAPHLAPLRDAEVATLAPRGGTHVLVREGNRPVLVQGSCGLGRVVLTAFDLDGPPFTAWDGQVDFWGKLQAELAPTLAARAGAGAGAGRGPVPGFGEEIDLRARLKHELESFRNVPVISFGIVALFILFYIALVGPLDYFILKKVFKRLELTWVTFPATVLLVSVLAYGTAYALKGDDLRINKTDVVEIDLHEPRQVYGTTWFALFSPRMQSYTIGLEPAAPAWVAEPPPGTPGAALTLMEGGDQGMRTGSQGLFPRPYEYAEDAAGLRQVPVRVWATRTFTASWRGPVKADAPPIDTREVDDRGAAGPLRASRTGEGLVGRLTNNLPVDLHNVALFYRGKYYELGTLTAGESRRVDPLFARDARVQGRDMSQWFDGDRMKSLLFHKASNDQTPNSGLRQLDQSWRLGPQPEYPVPDQTHFRDEAILFARTKVEIGPADAVTKAGASPSRLWLGDLPGARAERPSVNAALKQETYLRVYIPVRR
jgi:hypothetical protein